MKKPYLKKLGKVGRFAVWEVDGAYLREEVDPDFCNYGAHSGFDFIPKDELWLDREFDQDERFIFLGRMVADEVGVPRSKAIEAEEGLRALQGFAEGDVKIKELKKGIWLVSGNAVRSLHDPDFTQGGHWLVYSYIPAGEIWIDNDVLPKERDYVIQHEELEVKRMLGGKKYEPAHKVANFVEQVARKVT